MSLLSSASTSVLSTLALVAVAHAVFAAETASTATALTLPRVIQDGRKPNGSAVLIDLPADFHPACQLTPNKSAGTGG